MQSEKEIQTQIVDYLKSRGFFVIRNYMGPIHYHGSKVRPNPMPECQTYLSSKMESQAGSAEANRIFSGMHNGCAFSVWVSHLTIEDGADYNNQIIVKLFDTASSNPAINKYKPKGSDELLADMP